MSDVEVGDLPKVVAALVQLRIARGWTQRQLAMRMGTTQSAVSEFETGVYAQKLSTLQRYAAAVGARVEVSLVLTPEDELLLAVLSAVRDGAHAGM